MFLSRSLDSKDSKEFMTEVFYFIQIFSWLFEYEIQLMMSVHSNQYLDSYLIEHLSTEVIGNADQTTWW